MGRRFLHAIGWILLALVVGLYVCLPAAMAVAAVWPSRSQVGPTPAGFRDVTLRTADGVELRGWYAPARNDCAIVVVHGAGGSRESMRREATMIARHGYGVLALDLRGHGRSGGTTNRFGWSGTADVRAAVDFLKAQPGVRAIGGLGSSMGGEVLLGASGSCRELRAIVADGASRRSLEEARALPEKNTFAESVTPGVMFATVGLLARERPPAPLLGEMVRSRSTSFLLIAAGANQLEVAYDRLFAEKTGPRTELWVAPGVQHTGACGRYPEEYERRVIGFFDRVLSPSR